MHITPLHIYAQVHITPSHISAQVHISLEKVYAHVHITLETVYAQVYITLETVYAYVHTIHTTILWFQRIVKSSCFSLRSKPARISVPFCPRTSDKNGIRSGRPSPPTTLMTHVPLYIYTNRFTQYTTTRKKGRSLRRSATTVGRGVRPRSELRSPPFFPFRSPVAL